MKKYLLILTFLITAYNYAQNEANIWYFGFNAGLDFNSGSPVVLLDGEIDTNEGCATISDTNGQLLFYTDGVSVYNKNHNVMPNGSDLSGSWSSTHSAIAIPQPSDSNKYYIFTVDIYNNGDTDGLQYSEVDMTLDNGLGDITATKNIPLEPIVNEKVIAVLNDNEDGYWVVSHRHNTNEFIAFEVTNTGVSPIPVVSAVGSQTGFFNIAGQIKISPNGNKLAVARGGEVQLFDFNNQTGIVSNPMTLDNEVSSYGVEFSPNNNLLYIAFYGGVYQYDLQQVNVADIIASRVTLSNVTNQGYASMQIAPDGKIYVAKTFTDYLDVINNPNVVGLGCNYSYEGLYLGGRESSLGLPTFMQSFFNVGFQTEEVCEGEANQFNSNISQTYDSLVWDFGDGNTSTDENPVHTYANAGNYDVSLTVTTGTDNAVDIKTVTVYEVPTVAYAVTLSQCDDDLDGYSSFNLTEVNAEISVNHQNEIITYHETQLDAENDENPIVNDMDYINQTMSSDIIWARVENSFGCYAISEVNLLVSTTQIPGTFNRDFYQCDDGFDTTDGIATFDFSSVNSEIEALFPVGQQLSINYYRNENDALQEINPITDISNHQNMGYPNSQDIYIRADDLQNNDCLGLGHHITLHVESIPIAHEVDIEAQCDADGDGLFEFDTSDIESTLINDQTNVVVEYYDGLGAPLSSPLPNPFTTSTQDITARVINNNSQDLDGPCYSETVISFEVQEAVVAYPVGDQLACDDDNDGIYAFDTSNIEATILNGQTGVNVSYTDEDGDLLPSPLPNPFNTQSQVVSVRVENNLSSNCYDETQIIFNVYEQPIAHQVANDFVCNNSSNDSEHNFYLSDYDPEVLNGQSNIDFNVSYYTSLEDAQNNDSPLPNVYTISENEINIYARIENNNNTDCFDITNFQIGVSYLPIANQPSDMMLCDDNENDGIEMFDLSQQNTSILLGLSLVNNNLSFHLSQQDADLNSNPVGTNFENITNPQVIYARLENADNTNCYTTTFFSLIVQEKPVLLMEDQMVICEDDSVELIADFGYDQYTWSTGENTRNIFIDEPGQYIVTASNFHGDLVCSTEKTISVSLSDVAVITNIEITDWSQLNNSISIFVDGIGDYEYSLDNLNYQDSSTFNDLIIGDYTIYVRDKNGCGISDEEVYLLYYPRFFTPNDDGENDFWQIKNSAREPLNKLYIYNRYGKLIVQLHPNDFGWDGTYNGNNLPSDDYWFLLERQNGKTYTGHFALRR
jgi:gliding motility-associated-like protein